jgi:hypothetical protein
MPAQVHAMKQCDIVLQGSSPLELLTATGCFDLAVILEICQSSL